MTDPGRPHDLVRGWGRDLRLAARRLLATPLFTTFAVLSLAVGIGVTAVAYSVVDFFFFREPAVHEPDRVAYVMAPDSGRFRYQSLISRPDFDDLRASLQSFSSVAAWWSFTPSLAGPMTTELVQAEAVTGDYFSTLGVLPALGRAIQPADDDHASAVAVLSHDVWRRRFASDPRIVGRTVRVGGHSFEIVGVALKSFAGAAASHFDLVDPALWVPLGTATRFAPAVRWFAAPPAPGAPVRPERERRALSMVGRLRPGVSADTAAAELARLAATLDAAYPNTFPNPATRMIPRRSWTARTIADVRTEATELIQRIGIVVAGLVFLVLVVACTNLANLVLARGATRHHEFAVRRALGAARWRLIREQATESLLIAVAGGAAAFVVMRLLASWLATDIALGPSSILSLQPAVDWPMLVMAASALLMSLVVFGLEPAIQLTKTPDVRGHLAEGAGSVGVPNAKRQRTLLRWQVAISTGFFILATLSVRFVFTEMGHDPGMQIDRFSVASLNFYAQGWDEARTRRALDRVLAEITRDPAIESAAVSTGLPMAPRSPAVRLSTPDKPIVSKGVFVGGTLVAATPGLFRATGIPILRGRGFDDRDHAGAPLVVVINETAARSLFGTSDAIGRQILMQVAYRGSEQPTRTATVVGVARDTDTAYLSPRRSSVAYAPLSQHFDPFITVVARASRPSLAIGALQTAIRRADPDVAIEAVGSGRALLTGPYAFFRMIGSASLSLGLLTLGLAMVGLYGVQSHGVLHRTREIGVRMSFGATAAQIKRMILKDGYRPVVEGMAIGIFIGISGRAVIRAYLDAKFSIMDPWMLAVVPVPLILAAFCACYLPARRAANVDPNVALRRL
jgi:predicted permease